MYGKISSHPRWPETPGVRRIEWMAIPTGLIEGPMMNLQCQNQFMTVCLLRQKNGLRHVKKKAFPITGGSRVG